MTAHRLAKLREAFLFGATDEEACLLARIHPSTLYKYQQENEEFSEEKGRLKLNPVLKARQAIFKDLDNVTTAKWYLERKMKSEFGTDPKLTEESPRSIAELVASMEDL